MISLQLFGGAVLLGDTGPITGPPAQRRRLALLAMLAASPGGSVSRDKLIAYFWPEDDRERARHFLADSVFILRKHLGKDSILTVGDDLVLNTQAVQCDVCGFRETLAAGELERALAFYRGPFLDGFFVADAPEFEHWVEGERDRLAQLRASALEKLATEAEAAGSPRDAVAWWKQLATHDPLSSRVAMRLMQALASAGDRAAALQHARVHAALLRELLDVDPDPEIEALASRIAARASDAAVAPPSSPRVEASTPPTSQEQSLPAPTREAEPPSLTSARVDDVVQAASVQAADVVATGPHRSRRRWTLVPLVALLIGFFVIVTWRWRPDSSATPSDGTPAGPGASIAILPFRVLGNPENANLVEGLVILLSTELDVPGVFRPTNPHWLLSQKEALAGDDPLAPAQEGELTRMLGADLFLTGSLVESNGRTRFDASVYRPGDPSAPVVRASAQGTDLLALIDTISRQLIEGQLGAPGDRLSRIAVRTTSSTPALKAYLEGEHFFRAADYGRAAELFGDAVRLDRSFALAHYRLSMAEEWSFGFVEAAEAAENALDSSNNLSRRHQRLVRAWYDFITGDAERAEDAYDALLAEDPADVEALSGIGEVRAHYNSVRGRPIDQSEATFQKLLELAPDYGEARFHMMEFAAREGARARFDSLFAGVHPDSPQRLAWEAARAAAWGTPAQKAATTQRLARADEVVVGIAAARTAVHFRDLDAARTLAEMLMDPGSPEGWRAAGHIMAAQIDLAQGERALAAEQLAAAAAIEPAWAMEIGALAELLPGSTADAERMRQVRRDLEAWDPSRKNPQLAFFFATHADVHPQLRLYLLALLSVKLGDDQAAATYSRQLAEVGSTSEVGEMTRSLARSVEAHRAAARGDPETALTILEQDELTAPLERIAVSPFFARSLDRFLRAELLLRLNRPTDAAAWYASLSDGPDILFWEAAQRQR